MDVYLPIAELSVNAPLLIALGEPKPQWLAVGTGVYEVF